MDCHKLQGTPLLSKHRSLHPLCLNSFQPSLNGRTFGPPSTFTTRAFYGVAGEMEGWRPVASTGKPTTPGTPGKAIRRNRWRLLWWLGWGCRVERGGRTVRALSSPCVFARVFKGDPCFCFFCLCARVFGMCGQRVGVIVGGHGSLTQDV